MVAMRVKHGLLPNSKDQCLASDVIECYLIAAVASDKLVRGSKQPETC